jgi:hypothetical protein
MKATKAMQIRPIVTPWRMPDIGMLMIRMGNSDQKTQRARLPPGKDVNSNEEDRARDDIRHWIAGQTLIPARIAHQIGSRIGVNVDQSKAVAASY